MALPFVGASVSSGTVPAPPGTQVGDLLLWMAVQGPITSPWTFIGYDGSSGEMGWKIADGTSSDIAPVRGTVAAYRVESVPSPSTTTMALTNPPAYSLSGSSLPGPGLLIAVFTAYGGGASPDTTLTAGSGWTQDYASPADNVTMMTLWEHQIAPAGTITPSAVIVGGAGGGSFVTGTTHVLWSGGSGLTMLV